MKHLICYFTLALVLLLGIPGVDGQQGTCTDGSGKCVGKEKRGAEGIFKSIYFYNINHLTLAGVLKPSNGDWFAPDAWIWDPNAICQEDAAYCCMNGKCETETEEWCDCTITENPDPPSGVCDDTNQPCTGESGRGAPRRVPDLATVSQIY